MTDLVDQSAQSSAARPERFHAEPLPPIPVVSGSADDPSTQFSHYRTNLSHHRTGLSEHRTDLSEFRTDLSQHRTHLSDSRTEMSMRRTGMSVHRTRMSADRTLMSEIRTSLALIGFGFTIYQAFDKLLEAGVIDRAAAPRNLGIALIALGIFLLAGGVFRHAQFALELRQTRSDMAQEGLIHAESRYPVSVTLLTALALMAIGIAAIVGIAFDIPSLS